MNDITFEEFYELKKLFNSSEEDCQIGISNLNNLKYNDRKILNLLFVKSLPYNKRKIFLNNNIFFLCFSSKALIGKNIYNTIEKKGNKKIYKQILLQIMKNQ
jgi:hypothetical protein|tara:strand:- start:1004 stop:1309 length:306 start_codon:yes stop_codon:yes gene_type:complete